MGLLSKLCTELIQLNIKKKNLHLNMGKGPKQTFFQRGHTDGQQAQEKMFNTNISNHQRNADQKPMTRHLTSI